MLVRLEKLTLFVILGLKFVIIMLTWCNFIHVFEFLAYPFWALVLEVACLFQSSNSFCFSLLSK